MPRRTTSRSRCPLPLTPHFLSVMLLATAGICSQLAAQEELPEPIVEQASQRQFFDQVDVDLANVDVVVTDRQGRPVTGLSREDFEIFVDGHRVELTNFFEAGGATAPNAPAAAAAPAHPPGTTEQLNLAVVVDNRSIRPEHRKLLLERLREHLAGDSLAGGRIMLATLNRGLEVTVPFTEDRERVSSALDEIEKQGSLYALLDSERRAFLSRLQNARLRTYNPRGVSQSPNARPNARSHGVTGGAMGDPVFDDAISLALKLANDVRHLAEQRYQQTRATMTALAELSDALGGMPGRKALLYLSDGLPTRPADALVQAWADKYQNWALQSQHDFELSFFPDADRTFQQIINALNSSEFDLRRELRTLSDRASANRVAFYPISNAGRNSDLVSASLSGNSLGAGSGSGGARRSAQHLESFTRDASILQLADDTGGQALIRNANVGELLDRAGQDFRNFYALGYTRPNDEGTKPDSRSQRQVRVEVHRDDVLVRYGKTYRPKNWRDQLGAMTVASALFAAEDNTLGAALDPGTQVQQGKRFRVPIMITIPFDQIRLVYKDDYYRAQLTALVVVRNDEDGGYSEPQRIDFPVKIPGRRIMEAAQQQAGYLLELEMDGGPKRIAIGIRDHIAQTESTVQLDLVVGETL